MTNLLALDTATEACSVALQYKGTIFTHYEVIPRLHAQKILPMVSNVLKEAHCELEEIDGLAFGRGPGSFTGVRIAAGIIQGLAFALDKPVVAISNLAVIAQRAWREFHLQKVAVAIDARMNEIYWGYYQLNKQSEMCLLGDEQVLAPDQVQVLSDSADWYGVGTGWKYAPLIPLDCKIVDDSLLPDAQDLLMLALNAWQNGKTMDASRIEPVYLRDNVAKPKKSLFE